MGAPSCRQPARRAHAEKSSLAVVSCTMTGGSLGNALLAGEARAASRASRVSATAPSTLHQLGMQIQVRVEGNIGGNGCRGLEWGGRQRMEQQRRHPGAQPAEQMLHQKRTMPFALVGAHWRP